MSISKGDILFTGIDAKICEQAWQMTLPCISYAASRKITNKFAGCIVVVDPRLPYLGFGGVEELPYIYTAMINEDDDQKYRIIAHHKAHLTWKHKLSSADIQQRFPYLYEDGDTKWGGSTIDSGGLIVAFSGVQAVYDEMIAEWVASAIRAVCRDAMSAPDGVMSLNTSYIGE